MCSALGRLGVPRPFVVQLLLLYRYLCVMTEEASRLTRARELRGFGKPLAMRVFMSLIGHLLLRSWERAERIYFAMCARGFAGDLPTGKSSVWERTEWIALIAWAGALLALRLADLPTRFGQLVLGVF